MQRDHNGDDLRKLSYDFGAGKENNYNCNKQFNTENDAAKPRLRAGTQGTAEHRRCVPRTSKTLCRVGSPGGEGDRAGGVIGLLRPTVAFTGRLRGAKLLPIGRLWRQLLNGCTWLILSLLFPVLLLGFYHGHATAAEETRC